MKKIKFPLTMANGTQARSMEELKDNFDAASVVGYFMDGKLETWLNDRYYEEEAEQVAALSKDDPALARKLCAVFGIACAAEDGVDPEEIAYRQERLNRLKQYTDDESLWAQADKVAFDQEDLADLYDAGVEPIYLCAGSFKIPKSKQNLRYIAIAGAVAEGAQLTQPEKQEEPAPAVTAQPKFELKLSGDRLLKIAGGEKTELEKSVKCFTYNEKYVFAVVIGKKLEKYTKENNSLYRIDLFTGEKTKIVDDIGRVIKLFCTQSKVVWLYEGGTSSKPIIGRQNDEKDNGTAIIRHKYEIDISPRMKKIEQDFRDSLEEINNGFLIIQCDMDGDFLEVLAKGKSIRQVLVKDDYLYYNIGDKAQEIIYRLDLGNKERERVGKGKDFCIADDKLYSLRRRDEESDVYSIFSCGLDGRNEKRLASGIAEDLERITCNNGVVRCMDRKNQEVFSQRL